MAKKKDYYKKLVKDNHLLDALLLLSSFSSAVLFWRGDAEGLDFAIEGAGIDAEVRSGLAAVSAPAPQGLLNRRPFQAVKANHFIFSGFS